jgi:hypothetical protein
MRSVLLASRAEGKRSGRFGAWARVSQAIRLVLMMLIGVSLVGCFKDQKEQVARCERKAVRTYGTDHFPVRGTLGPLIQACMQVHGYEWDPENSRCRVRLSMVRNPFCYAPTAWTKRVVYEFESAIGE